MPELTDGEVPGTAYRTFSCGSIDEDLFDQTPFSTVCTQTPFLLDAPPLPPLLLLLNGHSSHYQSTFVHKAAEEEVFVPVCRLTLRIIHSHWIMDALVH